MSGSDSLVSLRGVTKWFGREPALRGIDLEVPRGTVTVLLGRNGSGKSTAMRICMGLLGRDGGDARVLGVDPERLGPAELDRIAYVTDASGAWAGTQVADEIALHRRIRGARWDATRARELLARFEVPEHKRLSELSKGLQTRLRLVLSLAANPELLVLDEPALGLDLFGRADLLDAIIETASGEGQAVVLVTHLLEDAERVADRIAFVRDGKAKVQGSTEELRDRFRRARFLVGEGGATALEAAASQLIGLRPPEREKDAPPDERVVTFEGGPEENAAPDAVPGVLRELEQRSGSRLLETRKLTLREIYFLVLGPREEVTA